MVVNWDDLRFFLAIARTGSLTAAARDLQISQPTVSRRLASLEKRLGVSLFDRTRHGYEPTRAGLEILCTAEHVEDAFSEIERRIFARSRTLTGMLRVTCTEPFANRHLCRHLGVFAAEHPGIDISLSCTLEKMNLSRRDADVAIRITSEPPEMLIGQRIAKVAVCAYGSAEFLSARPGQDPGWDWIGWRNEDYNRLFIMDRFPHARIKYRADDIGIIQAMTRHGMGIAALPCHLADPDPVLRRVVPEPILDGTPDLWVLYRSDMRRVARVRLFVDFLVERLRADRDLFEGRGAGEGSVASSTTGRRSRAP